MKKLAFVCAMLAALSAATHATADYVTPPGGLTIKDLVVYRSGWAVVTFVEPLSEISGCTPAGSGSTVWPQALWIDMRATADAASGKQVYATALTAKLLGKKVQTFHLLPQSGYCEMYALELAP